MTMQDIRVKIVADEHGRIGVESVHGTKLMWTDANLVGHNSVEVAERLIACANACVGISTGRLETISERSLKERNDEIRGDIDSAVRNMQRERDEALMALEKLLRHYRER